VTGVQARWIALDPWLSELQILAMVSPYQSQRKPRDHHILFAVRFEDGRSAYIRVLPTVADAGNVQVMAIAREQQERGEIPSGVITSVKRVR
jgi:hypothetical protein